MMQAKDGMGTDAKPQGQRQLYDLSIGMNRNLLMTGCCLREDLLHNYNSMGEEQGVDSCQLVGVAGILIQMVLGVLSFSVLVYKRYIERPKRAWRIWAMDTSKQGVSQLLAHFINIAISMQLSSKLASDACIWYVTTNILDNTLGVLLCVSVLGLIEKYMLQPNFLRFKSGNYYTVSRSFEEDRSAASGTDLKGPLLMPLEIDSMKNYYNISYFDWGIQFLIWNVIVIMSKSLMFQLEILLNGPIISIASFLLGWIQPYQTLELILVIIIIPVIMNGFAFWFQDNFLMKKEDAPVGERREEVTEATAEVQPEKNEVRSTAVEPECIVESVPRASLVEPRPEINDLLL